jgi:CheY-like chemotaxis protein
MPNPSMFSSRKENASPSTTVREAPIRVLVIDDEEPVRKYVERVLREAGYDTTAASDGPEALDIAAAQPPFKLVVTDLLMPKMNGDELARRLRQRDPSLKVLYLTGFSDRLFKDKVTLWEDEAFLEKPCSVKAVLEAVSLLLFGTCDRPQAIARQ